jgi:hypothetical protein
MMFDSSLHPFVEGFVFSLWYVCLSQYSGVKYVLNTRETLRVSYKRQQQLTLREHLSSLPVFFVGVRVHLQLFEKRLMSYLYYLCLLVHSGVQQILCYHFGLIFCSSRVPFVATFSGLPNFDCRFGIL